MPPDSWAGYLSSNPFSPNGSSSGLTFSRAGPRLLPRTSRPSVRLFITVRQGSSASFCGMNATREALPFSSFPSIRTSPASGFRRR